MSFNSAGIRIWDGTEAPDINGASEAEAASLLDKVVSKHANTTSRDTYLNGMTVGARPGTVAYTTGRGLEWYNGSTWLSIPNVKGGLITTTVEGNGNFRVPSASCFFNGVAPTSFIVMWAAPTQTGYYTTFTQFDGAGALFKAIERGSGNALPPGAGGTFFWMSMQ